jgi:dTDP-4-dehydrorhamnose reductase
MKVLILGSTGMLGTALVRAGRARGLEVFGAARKDAPILLDLLDDAQIRAVIEILSPEAIINAAGLTSIAECESQPGLAYRLNARAVHVAGRIAAQRKTWFIHISTDHYFIGDRDKRHDESAPVSLANEYARTKYAGELFALMDPGALVVRTNIMGFRGKSRPPSFLDWLLGAVEKDSNITAFDDFFTSSIHVSQLAQAIFDLFPIRPCGVLNIASSDVFSKKAFIELLMAKLGRPASLVTTGSILSAPGVKRAESLGLDVRKAESILSRPLPTLVQVAEAVVQEYQSRSGPAQ